jgi:hypothetical protein
MLQLRAHGVRGSRSGLFLTCLLILAFHAPPVEATRVRELGLADMATRAERIFVGECTSRTVREDPSGRPVTEYEFSVIRAIKGVAGPTVAFAVPGAPDGRGYLGVPVFEVGERALLLLYPPGAGGRTIPLGLDQGHFRLLLDRDGRIHALNGQGNRGLFRDVPVELLEEHGLAGRAGGPVRLDALEAMVEALAGRGRS